MFFKRLSRRNTSDSYIDQDYEPSPRDEKFDNRPTSSRQGPPPTGNHNSFPADEPPPHLADLPANSPTAQSFPVSKPSNPRHSDSDMYTRPRAGPQDAGFRNGGPPPPVNGLPQDVKSDPAPPDLLTQAFNAAIRPYSEKIEQMEAQMAELQNWADSLQQQRAELWEWIDKRGLRPGELPVALSSFSTVRRRGNTRPIQPLANYDPFRCPYIDCKADGLAFA
jgi:hypothetical protein